MFPKGAVFIVFPIRLFFVLPVSTILISWSHTIFSGTSSWSETGIYMYFVPCFEVYLLSFTSECTPELLFLLLSKDWLRSSIRSSCFFFLPFAFFIKSLAVDLSFTALTSAYWQKSYKTYSCSSHNVSSWTYCYSAEGHVHACYATRMCATFLLMRE